MVVSRKGGWSAAMRNLTVSSRDAPYLHIHDRPREAMPVLGWGHGLETLSENSSCLACPESLYHDVQKAII